MDDVVRNPGPARCLGGCDKTFNSVDKTTNRICPGCTKRITKERIPRIISNTVITDSGSVSLEAEE